MPQNRQTLCACVFLPTGPVRSCRLTDSPNWSGLADSLRARACSVDLTASRSNPRLRATDVQFKSWLTITVTVRQPNCLKNAGFTEQALQMQAIQLTATLQMRESFFEINPTIFVQKTQIMSGVSEKSALAVAELVHNRHIIELSQRLPCGKMVLPHGSHRQFRLSRLCFRVPVVLRLCMILHSLLHACHFGLQPSS